MMVMSGARSARPRTVAHRETRAPLPGLETDARLLGPDVGPAAGGAVGGAVPGRREVVVGPGASASAPRVGLGLRVEVGGRDGGGADGLLAAADDGTRDAMVYLVTGHRSPA
jgi:hypothetical protein